MSSEGWFFFFQAKDGIRDLVRFRGLGDVYKEQLHGISFAKFIVGFTLSKIFDIGIPKPKGGRAVSYTHLTLPTTNPVKISVAAVSLKKK